MAERLSEQGRPSPGKLKIFFGYASGVGKSFALLEEARRAAAAGIDVVIGYLDSQCPPQTLALAQGLEQLPPLPQGEGRGAEFHLDAALERRPQLLVIDRLAHANAPGCRHLQRYQDVQELLRAGIDVSTTVDVSQLESLVDRLFSLTGLPAGERIPDQLFDSAQLVQLVDLEPGELLLRLEGTKGGPGGGQPPSEKTLQLLREMALRRAADRLGRGRPAAPEARAGEHLLICLTGSPSNSRVIRAAARMAEAFHGDFTALHVEGSGGSGSEESQRRLQENQRLAQELGARIATVYGDDPAVQIAEYARAGGVSKIILGRSLQKRKFPFGKKSLMDRLSALAPGLDVFIIPDQAGETRQKRSAIPHQERLSAADICKTLGVLALCTLLGYLFRWMGLSTANIILVYLLGVLCVPMVTTGRSYSLLASALSVLVFNFFFTHPYFTLRSDPSYPATFAVMFLVALLSSSLTIRIKRQAILSAREAYRTEVLLETSQRLQKAEQGQEIIAVTATQLNKLLERAVLFYPLSEDGALEEPLLFPLARESLSACLTEEERSAAQWVSRNNKHAGATTGTLPNARCLYMAVRGTNQALAVAGIVIDSGAKPDAFEKNLMVAILDECGLAMEKYRMQQAKQKMEQAAKQEALRANLLRAISHDLRTPLTSISGNAGILMERSLQLEEARKQTLYLSIYDDAMWLVNLVENLLSVTRMENDSMALKMEPELLVEVFQEALAHLDRHAAERHIAVELEDDMLMAHMGARLIVQVLINLLNNAVKYTPPGSHITLSAKQQGGEILVSVRDDGPGIPDGEKERLFDMFYSMDNARGDGRRGMGLGLALCKSIISAHGGAIGVADNPPRGSCFFFTLQSSEVIACE